MQATSDATASDIDSWTGSRPAITRDFQHDADGHAKFWLDPVGLARSASVSPRELRQIESIVSDNHEHLLRSWHEYFDR